MGNIYLQRCAHPKQLINTPAPDNLSMVVVIPCHNEPDLLCTLQSLAQCADTNGQVEVLVIINESAGASKQILEQNQLSFTTSMEWTATQSSSLLFHIVYEKLPPKQAGVGLARKLGMDEAIRRFESLNKDGVIVCLDADCTCAPNYLTALESHFSTNPKTPGCAIYFEHPLQGPLDIRIYKGIAAYELHLRYYTHALRYAHHPFAFQTVGSSMAVRSRSYQKQGGMNKRQAGEDFYFLQNIFLLGNFTELKTTKVIPSPRVSQRVPFGTGKAMSTWIQENADTYYTYNYQTFCDLRNLILSIDSLFDPEIDLEIVWNKLPGTLQEFLPWNNFRKKVLELRQHTASLDGFRYRFFYWCNGFFVFKYAHFARDHAYRNMDVTEAAHWLLREHHGISSNKNVADLLKTYRSLDRSLQQVE